jgi:hypothetical protein
VCLVAPPSHMPAMSALRCSRDMLAAFLLQQLPWLPILWRRCICAKGKAFEYQAGRGQSQEGLESRDLPTSQSGSEPQKTYKPHGIPMRWCSAV